MVVALLMSGFDQDYSPRRLQLSLFHLRVVQKWVPLVVVVVKVVEPEMMKLLVATMQGESVYKLQ